jgi:hypothetical protein
MKKLCAVGIFTGCIDAVYARGRFARTINHDKPWNEKGGIFNVIGRLVLFAILMIPAGFLAYSTPATDETSVLVNYTYNSAFLWGIVAFWILPVVSQMVGLADTVEKSEEEEKED